MWLTFLFLRLLKAVLARPLSNVKTSNGQDTIDKDVGEKYNLTERSKEYDVNNPYVHEIHKMLEIVKRQRASLGEGVPKHGW